MIHSFTLEKTLEAKSATLVLPTSLSNSSTFERSSNVTP